MADDIRESINEIEEVDDFNFDGFQVVRREFFSHTYEVAVSFKCDSITFNTASINKFPDFDYVQLLVSPTEKRIVVKMCGPDDKDAIKWAKIKRTTQKREPRRVLCRLFSAKIFDLMGWNTENRYKIQGTLIKTPNETIIVFNLEETEVYIPDVKDENGTIVKHTPYFPEGWRDSFGLPVKEHEEALKINILDGYARMEVVQKRAKKKAPEANSEQLNLFSDNNKTGE